MLNVSETDVILLLNQIRDQLSQIRVISSLMKRPWKSIYIILAGLTALWKF